MASINKYRKYSKSDVKNREGGYKPELLFAPIDTFDGMATPMTTGNLGDRFKIDMDHDFLIGEGFIPMEGRIDTFTSKYSTDDDGITTHTVECEIEGDSPELYDQLQRIIVDKSIFLLKDANCIDASSYDQWGDSCKQAKVKVEFDAKTTAAGIKTHKLTMTVRGARYWYSGTVLRKP